MLSDPIEATSASYPPADGNDWPAPQTARLGAGPASVFRNAAIARASRGNTSYGAPGGADPPSHHTYAKALLASLTFGEWRPVAHEGQLFVLDPAAGIWLPKSVDALARAVAETCDGQPNCKRAPDYRAIAQYAIGLVEDQCFFAEAPIGLACADTFLSLTGCVITTEPLGP